MKGRRVRLFLRLTADVNKRLRTLMQYHGELSGYIDEALTSSDLRNIKLIPAVVGRTTRGMTAVISMDANDRLRRAAKRRRCTVTELANSAVDEWLRAKDALAENSGGL